MEDWCRQKVDKTNREFKGKVTDVFDFQKAAKADKTLKELKSSLGEGNVFIFKKFNTLLKLLAKVLPPPLGPKVVRRSSSSLAKAAKDKSPYSYFQFASIDIPRFPFVPYNRQR
jgi:hypothetical protein